MRWLSRYVVLVALAPAFAAASAPAVAAAQQPAATREEPVVVTTGEGIIQAAPDRAWVTISAESRGSNAREAQRRNTEAMRPVQDKLRAAGIPAEAIRTVAYDIQYEWDFVDGKRVGRGYVARNSIEVRIDPVEKTGEILELAVSSGATSVAGIRFDLKNRAQLERDALRLAVAEARARAEAAAAGAGRTLDRIVRIQEQGTPSEPVVMRTFALKEAADTSAPIAAGQIEIRAQVTFTASLK